MPFASISIHAMAAFTLAGDGLRRFLAMGGQLCPVVTSFGVSSHAGEVAFIPFEHETCKLAADLPALLCSQLSSIRTRLAQSSARLWTFEIPGSRFTRALDS